jgi:hypothetical protein
VALAESPKRKKGASDEMAENVEVSEPAVD